MMAQLKIKTEYRDIVPPQTKEEYEELKKSILENGQYAPISYNEEWEVLDGHHRYKICQELRLTPKIEANPRQFPSKLHEKLFVIDINLQRRQLTKYVRGRLALMTKPILKEIARINDKAKIPEKGQKGLQPVSVRNLTPIGRVDEEVGKRARLSRDTVRKIEVIEKLADKEDKKKLEQDKVTINAVFNKIEKQQAQQKIIRESPKIKLPEGIKLLEGDFMEQSKTIPDNSIDLIFTDPPYDKESLPLYEGLGEVAQRVLKEGGSLVAFAGAYALPEILGLIAKSGLKYWWEICVKHSAGHEQMFQRGVYVNWKPLLWFVKGKKRMDGLDSMDDYILSSKPDKSTHEWAQSPVEAEHVIKHLTISDKQTVFDPFMGDGNTGIAAVHLKRRFIGIEINKTRFDNAKLKIGRTRYEE